MKPVYEESITDKDLNVKNKTEKLLSGIFYNFLILILIIFYKLQVYWNLTNSFHLKEDEGNN